MVASDDICYFTQVTAFRNEVAVLRKTRSDYEPFFSTFDIDFGPSLEILVIFIKQNDLFSLFLTLLPHI